MQSTFFFLEKLQILVLEKKKKEWNLMSEKLFVGFVWAVKPWNHSASRAGMRVGWLASQSRKYSPGLLFCTSRRLVRNSRTGRTLKRLH